MSAPLCMFHLDCNFINLRPTYIKALLSELAGLGYNAVLWELEDKVQWDTIGEAAWPEAISKKELQDLLAHATELGMENIPLLQTIGHGEYILKHEAFRSMREQDKYHDCYCTESPEVRSFLKKLINEYLEVFGSINHFHLGGDEAYVFASCPTCKAAAEKDGHNAVYARHIMDISKDIRSSGARAGIWCDMVLNHPEQMEDIPTELEIWDWNYWGVDGPVEQTRMWGEGFIKRDQVTDEIQSRFPEILGDDDKLREFYTADALQRMGFDVFLCSSVRSAGDSFYAPCTHLHARNIIGAARKTAEAGLLGTCVTSWAIRLNNNSLHKHMLALAPMTLADPSKTIDSLLSEVTSEYFGTDGTVFLHAVDLISEVDFPFSRAHSTAVQWNRLKDSLPAPEGFIADLIQEWQDKGVLEQKKQSIEDAIPNIAKGMNLLNTFIHQAQTGLPILLQWSRAGWFQLWQARAAREIMNGPSPVTANLLRQLKQAYCEFMLSEQTPQSAAQNARLVYDALIEYTNG